MDEQTVREPQGNAAADSELARQIARALDLETVPSGESFKSLEGDSLAYIQTSMAIEQHLGYLPRHWESVPVGELEKLTPRTHKSTLTETDIVLRAGAILMVLAYHVGISSYTGGAMTLLMLAGYNCARFHSERLFDGDSLSVLRLVLTRIMLPYLIILLCYFTYKQDFHLPTLAFFSNLLGSYSGESTFLTPFWFLEVYFQIMLFTCFLFLIPPLRQRVQSSPWETGLIFLSISIAISVLTMMTSPEATLVPRLPHLLLYVFAFGWCLGFADTPNRRLMLMVLALVSLPLLAGPEKARGWIVAGAFLLLLWYPRLKLPRWIKNPVTIIAAASFYIYLVQNIPTHFLLHYLRVESVLVSGGLAIATAVIAGILLETGRRQLPTAMRWARVKISRSGLYQGSSSVSQ